MANALSIKGSKAIRKDLKKAIRLYKSSTKKSLNDSAKLFARKQAPEIVSSEWNLKKSSIKKRIEIKKATTSTLCSIVFISRVLPNATSFKGTRQTKTGLTVSYKKGKKTKIPGFLTSVKYKSGGKDKVSKIAVIRKNRDEKSGKIHRKRQGVFFPLTMRYPLESVSGPSVGRIIEDEETKRDNAIIPKMITEAEKSIDFLLNIK